MFDGLDDIPWRNLRHAYGEASDVPQQIRDLTSESSERRLEALHQLFGNIWHQGTVYEATPHALPFLIDMLKAGALDDSEGVALLVASIISGSGYHQVHSTRPLMSPFTGHTVPQPADLYEKLADERRIVEMIRGVGASAIDLLAPFLASASPDLRSAVSEALAIFPSRSAIYIPELEAALRSERDPEVREAMDRIIRELQQATPGREP